MQSKRALYSAPFASSLGVFMAHDPTRDAFIFAPLSFIDAIARWRHGPGSIMLCYKGAYSLWTNKSVRLETEILGDAVQATELVNLALQRLKFLRLEA